MRGEETYLPEAAVFIMVLFLVSCIISNFDVVSNEIIPRYTAEIPIEKALANIIISKSMELNRYCKHALGAILSQYDEKAHLLSPPSLRRENIVIPPRPFYDVEFVKRKRFSKSDHTCVYRIFK